mmetsp:Transcript_15550/g.36409  ORF Transcript_15550/g.36409 Transcript_15550/m.36409 type:complete len:273 (-) Transcript_15550:610-1428(-)
MLHGKAKPQYKSGRVCTFGQSSSSLQGEASRSKVSTLCCKLQVLGHNHLIFAVQSLCRNNVAPREEQLISVVAVFHAELLGHTEQSGHLLLLLLLLEVLKHQPPHIEHLVRDIPRVTVVPLEDHLHHCRQHLRITFAVDDSQCLLAEVPRSCVVARKLFQQDCLHEAHVGCRRDVGGGEEGRGCHPAERRQGRNSHTELCEEPQAASHVEVAVVRGAQRDARRAEGAVRRRGMLKSEAKQATAARGAEDWPRACSKSCGRERLLKHGEVAAV